MHKYYPILLNIENELCLVIGGGKVAERKVTALLSCGARVRVAGPRLTPRLARMAREERIQYVKRSFEPGQLAGARLVFAATDDRELNERIARLARENGQLVNAVDAPSACDFVVPSTLRKGALSISVATDGVSPALARRIRLELERTYGQGYARFLEEMARVRRRVLEEIPDPGRRRRILTRCASAEVLGLFSRGKYRAGAGRLHRILKRAGIGSGCGETRVRGRT